MKNRPVIVCIFVCAIVCASCDAPFDATGSYSGTWSFLDNETTIDNGTLEETAVLVGAAADNGTAGRVIDCPLSMDLEQDTTLDPPGNLSVSGLVHVDFSCLEELSTWPSWAEIPAPASVSVTGIMDSDGSLDLLSAGCGPGTCVLLALDGTAESGRTEGERKIMTRYSGDWGFAVGIAFLGNLGATGTFEVERDE